MRQVVERFHLCVEDVPSWEEDEEAATHYVGALSRDFMRSGTGEGPSLEVMYLETERDPSSVGEGGEERGVEAGLGQGPSKTEATFNVTKHEASSPQDLVCFIASGPRAQRLFNVSDFLSMQFREKLPKNL